MRLVVIIALCLFWIVLAGYEFKQGNLLLAGIFLLVGAVLTTMRLIRLRG